MVAYEYRCRDCGSVFEVRRAMTADAAGVRCPSGHDEVARIWSAVAVSTGASGPAPASGPASGGCCGGGCCG